MRCIVFFYFCSFFYHRIFSVYSECSIYGETMVDSYRNIRVVDGSKGKIKPVYDVNEF